MKSRKTFISILLTLALLISAVGALPISVFAIAGGGSPTYPDSIFVGGVEMAKDTYLANGASSTTTAQPTEGGFAHYNSEGVLTLNNYVYSGDGTIFSISYKSVIYVEDSGSIKINLIGENTLTNTDDGSAYDPYGIYVEDGALDISGDGALAINAITGITVPGGYVNIGSGFLLIDARWGITESGGFAMTGGTVKIISEQAAISVRAAGSVAISGGNLTVSNTSTQYPAINKAPYLEDYGSVYTAVAGANADGTGATAYDSVDFAENPKSYKYFKIEGNDKVYASFSLRGIDIPAEGETPADLVHTPIYGGNYHMAHGWSISYNDGSGWQTLQSDSTTAFVAGQEYVIKLSLELDEGYSVADGEKEVTVNGNPATIVDVDDSGSLVCLEIEYAFIPLPPPSEKITNIYAEIIEPVGGASPIFQVIVGSAGYTPELEWEIVAEETIIYPEDNYKFKAGEEYGVYVAFKAWDGYEFADGVTITINGKTPEAVYRLGEDTLVGFVTYTADTPITSVKVSDVTAPVVGAKPDFDVTLSGTGSDIGGACEYIAEWYYINSETDEWEYLSADASFNTGLYSLTVSLKVEDGYAFTKFTKFYFGEEELPLVDESYKSCYYLKSAEFATVYLFFNVEEATTYTVSFNANGGSGSMNPVQFAGEYTLPTCGFTAPTGKQFKGWATSANGSVIEGTTYNVTANAEFFAIWENIPVTNYTVNATAGANGTISPSGEVTVAEGEDKTFTITANTGYHIKDVKVNGSSVGAVATYTFTHVTANATITVEFEVDTVPHVCNPTLVPEDEPDCLTAGKSAYYHCGCGKNYEDAQGNTEIENIETWGILNALNHEAKDTWSSDADNHWKECARCSGQQLEKAAHADTDNNGKCDTCEYQMSTTPNNPDNPNNTPDNPNNTPDDPSDDKDGLGAGGVIGIVLASLVVLGLGGFAIYWFLLKKKSLEDLLALVRR